MGRPATQPARGVSKHPWWKWLLAWTVALGGVATMILTVGILGTVWWFGRQVDVDPERLLDYRPHQVTRILARDGTPIGELVFDERRTVVDYDELPEHLVHAFLAAEDADFFEHDGLDWPGIARAAVANLTPGRGSQGASTITQQVIKNTLLTHARTVERKSQELVLAGRVEAVLDKRQILEIYVNEVYFGEGRYGVEEAARWYFGKHVADVDLGEAAALAALPHAPGVVTPYRRVDDLEARRDYVLRQMREHGFARAEDIAPYLGAPIVALEHPRDPPGIGEAEEFVALARAELIRRYGEEALPTLGATVRTSVDLDLQREARSAGRRELAGLEARHGYGHHARPLSKRARKRLEARAPEHVDAGSRQTAILDEPSIETVHPERAPAAARLRATVGVHPVTIELPESLAGLPPAELARRFPAGSAIEVRITAPPSAESPAFAELGPGPEFALALADVRSGELRALIGGRQYARGGFDRATSARRQPGSSFKPILYGAAIASREFTAASTAIGGGQGGVRGEPMRLRSALAHSDNAVALALMRAVGHERVDAFARDLGVASELGRHLSLALGTSEMTPLELMTAYLTLARGGAGIEPKVILEIEVPPDLHGQTPEPVAPEPTPRLFSVDAGVAAVVTSMMASVVDEGTGKQAADLGRPVVGKTGTTDEARDAWFAGYTPDHVAVTWVGFDSPRSLGARESGSHVALPIWVAAMRTASDGTPVREFDEPPTLVHATIDADTGGPACRQVSHWYEPERCTPGWFGDSCTPARWRTVEPFLRCVEPERWMDEVFLPGTEPDSGLVELIEPIGEAPTEPDPDERGGPATVDATAQIATVSLFTTADDPPAADDLDEHLRPLEVALARRWGQALQRYRGELDPRETHAWSRAQMPPGTKVGVTVRLDALGDVDDVRTHGSSGDTNLDAWAEAAVRAAVRDARRRPLAVMLEPIDRTAELTIDFIVGTSD